MGSEVPKCKECEYHKYKSLNGRDKERHYCCEPSKLSIGSFIKANEYKISPKWCPKRSDNLKSKDLNINKELSLKEKIQYINGLGKKDPTLNLLINLENQGLGHISITEILDLIATNTKVELPNRKRSLIIE